jgi:TPR repeat protein
MLASRHTWTAVVAPLTLALAMLGGCGSPSHPALAGDDDTREVYQRDCDEGVGSACFEFGESYLAGQWGPADPARGLGFLERACELRYASACAHAATMTAEGRGRAPDAAQARALLQRACDDGSPRACVDTTRFAGAAHLPSRRVPLTN